MVGKEDSEESFGHIMYFVSLVLKMFNDKFYQGGKKIEIFEKHIKNYEEHVKTENDFISEVDNEFMYVDTIRTQLNFKNFKDNIQKSLQKFLKENGMALSNIFIFIFYFFYFKIFKKLNFR